MLDEFITIDDMNTVTLQNGDGTTVDTEIFLYTTLLDLTRLNEGNGVYNYDIFTITKVNDTYTIVPNAYFHFSYMVDSGTVSNASFTGTDTFNITGTNLKLKVFVLPSSAVNPDISVNYCSYIADLKLNLTVYKRLNKVFISGFVLHDDDTPYANETINIFSLIYSFMGVEVTTDSDGYFPKQQLNLVTQLYHTKGLIFVKVDGMYYPILTDNGEYLEYYEINNEVTYYKNTKQDIYVHCYGFPSINYTGLKLEVFGDTYTCNNQGGFEDVDLTGVFRDNISVRLYIADELQPRVNYFDMTYTIQLQEEE